MANIPKNNISIIIEKKNIIKTLVFTESMEIWRKMGVWRKVISLDQSYLIENDSLPLLNMSAYNVRTMTTLTFILPFLFKRQLLRVLLMIKYSKILDINFNKIIKTNFIISNY